MTLSHRVIRDNRETMTYKATTVPNPFLRTLRGRQEGSKWAGRLPLLVPGPSDSGSSWPFSFLDLKGVNMRNMWAKIVEFWYEDAKTPI